MHVDVCLNVPAFVDVRAEFGRIHVGKRPYTKTVGEAVVLVVGIVLAYHAQVCLEDGLQVQLISGFCV